MYISKCCVSPVFGTKIIDSHVHTGNFKNVYFDKEHLEPFFNKLPNGDVVEKMIVSDLDPLQGIQSQKARNEYIMKHLAEEKYAILASCNVKENVNDLRVLLQENEGKFVGLKFHPHLQNIEIQSNQYKPYFELATEFKLPCLIHTAVDLTENGIQSGKIEKFADPKGVYAMAKLYKETPFVMAHLGSGWNDAHRYTTDIIIDSIKKGNANLYADFSWVDIDHKVNGKPSKEHLLNAIKRLKGIGEKDWKYGDQSFRLMFGSDAPIDRFSNVENRVNDYSKYIEEVKTAIRNDNDLKADAEKIIDDLFYNNAKKLYKINDNKQPVQKSENGLGFISKHAGKIALGAILALIGILALSFHNDKDTKNKQNLSLVV